MTYVAVSENGGYKGNSHGKPISYGPLNWKMMTKYQFFGGKAAHVDLPWTMDPVNFPASKNSSGINGSQQSLGRKGREQEIFWDMPTRIVPVAFFATRRRKIGKTLANYHWACLEIRGSNCPRILTVRVKPILSHASQHSQL